MSGAIGSARKRRKESRPIVAPRAPHHTCHPSLVDDVVFSPPLGGAATRRARPLRPHDRKDTKAFAFGELEPDQAPGHGHPPLGVVDAQFPDFEVFGPYAPGERPADSRSYDMIEA